MLELVQQRAAQLEPREAFFHVSAESVRVPASERMIRSARGHNGDPPENQQVQKLGCFWTCAGCGGTGPDIVF